MSCPRSRSRRGWRAVKRFELGDQRVVPAERQLGLDPLLDRDEPELLQPFRVGAREVLVGDLGQRLSAPECEGRLERLQGIGGLARCVCTSACVEQPLESSRVDRVGLDLEDVAAASREQELVRSRTPSGAARSGRRGCARRSPAPGPARAPRSAGRARPLRWRAAGGERAAPAVSRLPVGASGRREPPRSARAGGTPWLSFGSLRMTLAPAREDVESRPRPGVEAAPAPSGAWSRNIALDGPSSESRSSR